MEKLISLSDMQRIAVERGGRCLSPVYINEKNKLKWQCAAGHEWDTSPKQIKKGHWCPECMEQRHRDETPGPELTLHDMQKIGEEKGGWCLSTRYLGWRNKLLWKCAVGHTWEARPSWIMSGHWCPKCAELRSGRRSDYTIEKLTEGFKRFFSENGHFPSAHEVDAVDYLPSSRQIQRAWGGLQELRKKIGLANEEVNLTKGSARSKMASHINKRGTSVEDELEVLLVKKFGEIAVHSQQVVKTKTGVRLNVDFFVYTPTRNFCVDTFWSSSPINSKNILRNKINKYSDLEQTIYLVETNPKISEETASEFINGYGKGLPKHIFLETLDGFLRKIEA